MSGHSHAKTVKRTKDSEDKKRSQAFSKISKAIFVAIKEKGDNPETNPKLRSAIELARSANMPKENIERIIKKASSGSEAENLEEAIYEAYGPGGIAIIIEVITDNKNRSINEIRQILSRYNGKMVSEGGAKWMFERKVSQKTNKLEWIPKQEMEISEKEKESCKNLFEALDENDSVQEIHSNLKE